MAEAGYGAGAGAGPWPNGGLGVLFWPREAYLSICMFCYVVGNLLKTHKNTLKFDFLRIT